MRIDNVEIIDDSLRSATTDTVKVERDGNIEGANSGVVGGAGSVSGYIDNYIVADWGTSGTEYVLDINHNLDQSLNLIQTYDTDTSDIVILRTEKINNNTIRLKVPQTPDGRFNVSVVVK